MIKHTDKILVIDLESTCWENDIPPAGEQSEIIQIGWSWVSLDNPRVLDKTAIYIKPQRSKVSEYCTALTGIAPRNVKSGFPFQHACKWLVRNLGCRSRAWAAWGGDKTTFEAQCKDMGCEMPFSEGFYNLQLLYSIFMPNPPSPRPSLERSLEELAIIPVGKAHRADNDAWDAAQVLVHLLQVYRKGTVQERAVLPPTGV